MGGSSREIDQIAAAIEAGAAGDELAALPLPDSFRAVVVTEEGVASWGDVPAGERDPAATLRVAEVPRPEIAADEVLLAVRASSLNYTTVWSAIAHPVPTFGLLRRSDGPGHDAPFHVVGSDAAGVVLRVGAAVRRLRPGDHVVVNPAQVDPEQPGPPADRWRVWGYETNYGGLAELAVARAAQLLPKPPRLTWEEAASSILCGTTAYRMLVGDAGARLRQGDVVLVWGAAGGVGSFAVQLVRNGGGVPVGVVSSAERAAYARALGCELVIDRAAEGYRFWRDDGTPDESEWRRLGSRVRELAGADPDIVVEHPGRETMGASVYVVRPGGTVVTCAATSDYRLEIDARQLWMRQKRVVGTQLASPAEAAAFTALLDRGAIRPALTAIYPLERTAEAARRMRANRHAGKLGVRCLAPDRPTTP